MLTLAVLLLPDIVTAAYISKFMWILVLTTSLTVSFEIAPRVTVIHCNSRVVSLPIYLLVKLAVSRLLLPFI
jgi:hypothetical protein